MALVLAGTDAQKERWLPRLASGEWIAAFALTEPNAGSDAQAIETRAVRDGDRFILNGTKHYISRGDIADLVTVFAVTDPTAKSRARGGITAFVVEKGTPGFRVARIQESMGSDVVKQAELVFEDCAVPRRQRRRRNRPGIRDGDANPRSRPPVARGSLSRNDGGAPRGLRRAREEPRSVRQTDRGAAGDSAHAGRHGDGHRDAHGPRFTPRRSRRDAGETVTHDAAMLKLYASEALGRAADRAVQIHGGMGFMRDCVVEGIYREARMMRIVEGTSEIQRMLIARGVLEGHLSR